MSFPRSTSVRFLCIAIYNEILLSQNSSATAMKMCHHKLGIRKEAPSHILYLGLLSCQLLLCQN